MKTETTNRLSLIAFILLALQYTLYRFSHMQPSAGGGLVSVIAYQFQFIMLVTLSVGVYVPLSLWLETKTGRPNSAWIYGILLFLLTATGFAFISYARLSHEKPSSAIAGAGDNLLNIPQSTANSLANYVQFVDAQMMLQKNDETLRIILNFRNLSKKDITQMDYIFVSLEDGRIFYRINIRDGFLVPAEKMGANTLIWDRTKFKNPALFDKMRAALKANTLRVYAKATRVVFMDGTSIKE